MREKQAYVEIEMDARVKSAVERFGNDVERWGKFLPYLDRHSRTLVTERLHHMNTLEVMCGVFLGDIKDIMSRKKF